MSEYLKKLELLAEEDLVSNPTARVPVCLCLDTSGSMDGKPIDELNQGVQQFYDAIRDDETAIYAAEICIITFSSSANKVVDFATVERQTNIPQLVANGMTYMGEAVNMALDCLEDRKETYKKKGVDYYQPWLVLMTDGEPNGSVQELERAVSRTCALINSKKLVVFPIGIGDSANMSVLARFSPGRTPLKLIGTNFGAFFQWLSQSVSRTSQSMPGENVKLDVEGIKGWAEL